MLVVVSEKRMLSTIDVILGDGRSSDVVDRKRKNSKMLYALTKICVNFPGQHEYSAHQITIEERSGVNGILRANGH